MQTKTTGCHGNEWFASISLLPAEQPLSFLLSTFSNLLWNNGQEQMKLSLVIQCRHTNILFPDHCWFPQLVFVHVAQPWACELSLVQNKLFTIWHRCPDICGLPSTRNTHCIEFDKSTKTLGAKSSWIKYFFQRILSQKVSRTREIFILRTIIMLKIMCCC